MISIAIIASDHLHVRPLTWWLESLRSRQQCEMDHRAHARQELRTEIARLHDAFEDFAGAVARHRAAVHQMVQNLKPLPQ